MVTVFVIAGSGVRPIRIVPATSKSMVLGPGWLLDPMIAWRSEPAPALWRLVAANVDRSSRPSRTSRPRSVVPTEAWRFERASLLASPVRERFTELSAIVWCILRLEIGVIRDFPDEPWPASATAPGASEGVLDPR